MNRIIIITLFVTIATAQAYGADHAQCTSGTAAIVTGVSGQCYRHPASTKFLKPGATLYGSDFIVCKANGRLTMQLCNESYVSGEIMEVIAGTPDSYRRPTITVASPAVWWLPSRTADLEKYGKFAFEPFVCPKNYECLSEGPSETGLRLIFRGKGTALPPQVKLQIDALAPRIKRHEDDFREFAVGGHVRSESSRTVNYDVSEQLAQAVIDYLVTKHGIKRQLFSIRARGDEDLIAFPAAANVSAIDLVTR